MYVSLYVATLETTTYHIGDDSRQQQRLLVFMWAFLSDVNYGCKEQRLFVFLVPLVLTVTTSFHLTTVLN